MINFDRVTTIGTESNYSVWNMYMGIARLVYFTKRGKTGNWGSKTGIYESWKKIRFHFRGFPESYAI